MMLIGVDYHPSFQQIAFFVEETGECGEQQLNHSDGEAVQIRVFGIDKSEIVIADFTLNPANVYFEFGYARGRKCQIIQTARKGTLLEFDTRNWRTLFYKNATELETRLESALTNAYAEVVGAGAAK